MGIVLSVTADTTQLLAKAARLPGFGNVAGEMGANTIKRRAIQLVPVRTGELRGSIGVGHSGGEWFVFASAEHAGYVEFGTYKMSAQPYLRPAAQSVNLHQIGRDALKRLGF